MRAELQQSLRRRSQCGAVLAQSVNGVLDPRAVPPVSHLLWRLGGMRDSLGGQECVVVVHVGLKHLVAANPDSVVGHERRLVGFNEARRQAIVSLEVGVRPIVIRGARTELVVAGHVRGEVPGCRRREEVRVLQEQILPADAGLGEADQPVLLVSRHCEVLRHPRHEVFGDEGLVLEVRVVGIVRVPGIDGEGRLNDRQVVPVLRVEAAQRLEPVAEDGSQLGSTGRT